MTVTDLGGNFTFYVPVFPGRVFVAPWTEAPP